MKALEDDTDYKLRTVKESELNLMEMDETSLRQNLKDRQHGNDYINDVEEGRKRLEQYIKVFIHSPAVKSVTAHLKIIIWRKLSKSLT